MDPPAFLPLLFASTLVLLHLTLSAQSPAFSLRLGTLPGNPNAGVVEIKPDGKDWGGTCDAIVTPFGWENPDVVPRLACRKMGLPWRKARRVNREPYSALKTVPPVGALVFNATRAGIDNVQLLYQTNEQLWASMYGDRPLPQDAVPCYDGYGPLVIECTDSPQATPSLRLVAHGNLTGPRQGVVQLRWQGYAEGLHMGATFKDCPEDYNDYLWSGDEQLYLTYEPITFAQTVCRQLGLPYEGAKYSWAPASGLLAGSVPAVRFPLCTGREPNLSYCDANTADTRPQDPYRAPYTDDEHCEVQMVYYGVTCEGLNPGESSGAYPEVTPPLPPSPPPRPRPPPGSPAAVRLAYGSREWGQVQVALQYNGTRRWASFCATADYDEGVYPHMGLQAMSAVVCRELGLPWRGAAKTQWYGGITKGQLYVQRIDCKGNEQSIKDCTWSGEVTQCNQAVCECYYGYGPYGASCRDEPTQSGDIIAYRLETGSQLGRSMGSAGVVGVLTNHIFWDGPHWGYVCKDGFNNKAAQVVCRSLGKPYSKAKAVDASSRFPGVSIEMLTSGKLLLDDLNCTGKELQLAACGRKTVSERMYDFPIHDCVDLWDAAAVECA